MDCHASLAMMGMRSLDCHASLRSLAMMGGGMWIALVALVVCEERDRGRKSDFLSFYFTRKEWGSKNGM